LTGSISSSLSLSLTSFRVLKSSRFHFSIDYLQKSARLFQFGTGFAIGLPAEEPNFFREKNETPFRLWGPDENGEKWKNSNSLLGHFDYNPTNGRLSPLRLSTGGGPVTKKHCEKSDENHQLSDLQNNPKIFQTIPIVVLLIFKNLFNPSVFVVSKFSNAAF